MNKWLDGEICSSEYGRFLENLKKNPEKVIKD